MIGNDNALPEQTSREATINETDISIVQFKHTKKIRSRNNNDCANLAAKKAIKINSMT